MCMAIPICRRLFVQVVRAALSLALAKAGNNMAAKMAMMAMTTSNSMSVNAGRQELLFLAVELETIGMFMRSSDLD